MAMLAVAEGDSLAAATLADPIHTYRQAVAEIPFSEVGDGTFNSYTDRAREAVGDERWNEVFESGRKMSLEAAARGALEPAPATRLSPMP